MDADCLIKLTKAGAKEAVLSAMEVCIPLAVKREAVDAGKASGYADASVIEENINKGKLRAIAQRKGTGHAARSIRAMVLHGGEKELLSLYDEGGYHKVASDDGRFLKKLDALSIPYMTAATCILHLYHAKRATKSVARDLLERLKPSISEEEYSVHTVFLEGEP